MPGKKRDAAENGGGPSGSVFTKTVFGFFSSVLKSIARDDLLRVAWGVEVLLFVILAFMIWFGDITRDQRFGLAILIIASVVFMFVFTARRSQGRSTTPRAACALIDVRSGFGLSSGARGAGADMPAIAD